MKDYDTDMWSYAAGFCLKPFARKPNLHKFPVRPNLTKESSRESQDPAGKGIWLHRHRVRLQCSSIEHMRRSTKVAVVQAGSNLRWWRCGTQYKESKKEEYN